MAGVDAFVMEVKLMAAELDHIESGVVTDLKRATLHQWEHRVVTFLKQNGAESEANRLISSRSNRLDSSIRFIETVRKKRAVLQALIKDAEQQPDYWDQRLSGNSLQPTPAQPTVQSDRFKVAVIYGRNTDAYDSMCLFLQAIGLEPLEWHHARAATEKATPYVLEVVESALRKAGAVVALFTPDDLALLKPEFQRPDDPEYEKQQTGQARPNVLLETGIALAIFQQHVVLVQIGSTRPLSDLEGLHYLRLDNSEQYRRELAQRLKTAGCPVPNLDGTKWLKAGDFEGCLRRPSEPASFQDKDMLQQYEKAINEIPENYGLAF